MGKEEPVNDDAADKVEDVEEVEDVADEATYDLGGRVIKIVNSWDMTPEGGTEIGDLTVARWKDVEEKYNVTIEWHVVTWEEKINLLTASILAGEPIGDIVGVDSIMTASLIQHDYIHALDDLVDVSTTKLSDTMKDMGTFDDKVYLLKREVSESGGMYYNKTMFEQAGLPDPYELQEAGEWTWEAMLDAAKRLTNETTYGLSIAPNYLAEYLIFSNDALILDTETGEVTMDSPNAMEGLEFMSSLYNEHKVIKPNEGDTWNDPRKYFTEGSVGMTQGWLWEAGARGETPFEWGYVFWPKGPKATDYVTPVNVTEGMVIPKGVEDPEIVYQIWEDMQMWEYEREGTVEWFEEVLPNEESVDTATKMLDKIRVNYWPAHGIADAFWETFENISTGAESPSQAIAKVMGEAQSLVDEFLGKE